MIAPTRGELSDDGCLSTLKCLNEGHRICQAGLEMTPSGVFKDGSRLQEFQIEAARHYFLTAIRNTNTTDYLAFALVALAALRMKIPDKIRCFRTFTVAA